MNNSNLKAEDFAPGDGSRGLNLSGFTNLTKSMDIHVFRERFSGDGFVVVSPDKILSLRKLSRIS